MNKKINNETAQKSFSLVLIIIIILAIIFAGYFGLAWILRIINKNADELASNAIKNVSTNITESQSSSEIVGTWDTECLVPDANSPWAERHVFTINDTGTALHQRYSGTSCSGLTLDNNDQITYTIPKPGQINLNYTSGVAAGARIYDIYNIPNGDTLKFGHGFCNCTTGGDMGNSEATRFSRLNDFLVYKKVSD